MNTKKALAKLDIIRAWHNFLDKYREMENYVTVEIQYLFCRLYNQHLLAIAPLTTETYSVVARISRAQLCRDLARYNNEGIDALGITWGGRRKSGTEIETNPDLKAAIDKYIAYGCTKFGPAKILKLLKTQEDFDKLPSVCQIRSYLGKFKRENPMVWLELASKDQAKNHYGIAYGKYKTDFPNQVWELDGSPDDILLNVDGVARRYQALFLIDRCTRDVTIDIAESENSTATKKLLRKAIASRGIPDKIVTDNGSGFKAEKTQSMIERLGIELEFCPPGRPEKKPFVERVIRTFQDVLRVLPGYIGKNTKERADLRSNDRADCDGLLTLDQFKEWCDRWVKQYRTEFHHGLDCSPIEKIAQATKDGWNPVFIPDNRVLDFLLLEDKSRKVGKQGIRLNNRFYIDPELCGLIGQDVHVCWDIESADKI
jgi:transposase InsO family protein